MNGKTVNEFEFKNFTFYHSLLLVSNDFKKKNFKEMKMNENFCGMQKVVFSILLHSKASKHYRLKSSIRIFQFKFCYFFYLLKDDWTFFGCWQQRIITISYCHLLESVRSSIFIDEKNFFILCNMRIELELLSLIMSQY